MMYIDSEKSLIKCWTEDVEEQAIQQLKNVANMPFIHSHIAVMPDVHAGYGATIGSVIPTLGAVIPSAVGVDIGCGMCAVPTNLKAEDLDDDLKKLRLDIESKIPVGFGAYQNTHRLTPLDSYDLECDKKAFDVLSEYKIGSPKQGKWNQLGTLGGGNHFIEICLDESDDVWVMLHSGSRGIGNRIGTAFIEIARKDMETYFINVPDRDLGYLPEGTKHFDAYITAVDWAQRYASKNREIMMRRVFEVLKEHYPQMVAYVDDRMVNCHHNYVRKENHFGKNVLLTRKGAVSAKEGEMGIIPGSMGAKSYIVRGKGNPQSFCSCSHGAGRRMSRKKAKATFSIENHMEATKHVESRVDENVIDETPMAYKDIDKVMEEQADLVDTVHTLRQVVCVKG